MLAIDVGAVLFIKEGCLWACGFTGFRDRPIHSVIPCLVRHYSSVKRLQSSGGNLLIWETDGTVGPLGTSFVWKNMTSIIAVPGFTGFQGICDGEFLLNVSSGSSLGLKPQESAVKATFDDSQIIISLDYKDFPVFISIMEDEHMTSLKQIHSETILEWQKYDLGVQNTLLQDAINCCKSEPLPSLTSTIFREAGSNASLIVDNNRLYTCWREKSNGNFCSLLHSFDQKILYATREEQLEQCIAVVLEGGWLWFRGANRCSRFGLVPDRDYNVWRMAAYRVFIPIMKISSRAAARFTDVSFVFEYSDRS